MDVSAQDFILYKLLQTVTLDILIQFKVLVCSIRVFVPRRAKEGDCV
jgi:hypothetical protein